MCTISPKSVPRLTPTLVFGVGRRKTISLLESLYHCCLPAEQSVGWNFRALGIFFFLLQIFFPHKTCKPESAVLPLDYSAA